MEIVKLEKGVSLTIRNDASFIIDMNISFYEHQSTYSENLPLRNLIYLANTLENWLKENKRDLFGSRQIKIPTPYFVVENSLFLIYDIYVLCCVKISET